MIKVFKKLFRQSAVYSFGGILDKGISFLLLPFYTAYLTTAEFGIVGIMTVLIQLAVPLVKAPVSNGFVRYYYSHEISGDRKVLFFNGLFFIVVQLLVLSFLLLFGNKFFASLLLDDENLDYIVTIYAIILFFLPVKQYLLSLLRIQQKSGLYFIVSVSRAVISAAVTLYLLIVVKMGVMAVVYGQLLRACFDLVILFPYLLKNIAIRIDIKSLKPLLKYGYPLILTAVSLYFMQSSDRFIMKMHWSLDDLGIYSFAFRFGMIINIALATPVKYALNPIIFKMEGDNQDVNPFISRSTNYFFFIALLFWLVLSVFSKELVYLIAQSKDFYKAWKIVPVVALISVMNGGKDFFGKGIAMASKTQYSAAAFVMGAVLNVILNLLFIPFWNIYGAVAATLLSFLFLAGLNIHYSGRFYNLKFNLRLIAITILISFMIFGISLFANSLPLIFSIPLKGLLILVFPLILYYGGFFKPEEKSYIRQMLMKVSKGSMPFSVK